MDSPAAVSAATARRFRTPARLRVTSPPLTPAHLDRPRAPPSPQVGADFGFLLGEPDGGGNLHFWDEPVALPHREADFDAGERSGRARFANAPSRIHRSIGPAARATSPRRARPRGHVNARPALPFPQWRLTRRACSRTREMPRDPAWGPGSARWRAPCRASTWAR